MLLARAPNFSWRQAALWIVLGALIVAQLAAIWRVCLGQVRRAQARHEDLPVEQRAVEDCVRRNSQDSLVSCADRATDQHPAGTPGN